MKPDFIQTVIARSEEGDFFFRPILMQFAAQYIGASYRDFYLDHRILVEANIACMDALGMDAVGLISDPMREAEAFGAECEYPEQSVPHCPDPPVKTFDDVLALPEPDVYKAPRTRDRIEGARLFRQRLGGDLPVIGWIEGPLAEACDIVGVTAMLIRMARDPDFSNRLLLKMVRTAKAFAQAQIDAGCDIIGMGDAICSQISPEMYADQVMEHHREIIDFVHQKGALLKLHICGNISHLLPFLRALKPDIVDLDWMVDMNQAYKILGSDIVRAGNLDPAGVIEQLGADEVYQRTKALVESERGRPFILSAGCEVTPLTPGENVLAMRRASSELW